MLQTINDLTISSPDTSTTFYTVVTTTANERKRSKAASKLAYRVITARRNGSTQRWKTRPTEYRIPAKYGLRDTFQITHESTGWTDSLEQAQQLADRLNAPLTQEA